MEQVGFKINNLLNEDYESPHGFSQEGMKFEIIVKNKLKFNQAKQHLQKS